MGIIDGKEDDDEGAEFNGEEHHADLRWNQWKRLNVVKISY